METMPKYIPSGEEIEKAEGMMGSKQTEVSKEREEMRKKWENSGISGYLMSTKDSQGKDKFSYFDSIQGIINGHNLRIEKVRRIDRNSKDEYEGSIDDHILQKEQAEALFNKYKEFGVDFSEQRFKENGAKEEQSMDARDLAVEELLK